MTQKSSEKRDRAYAARVLSFGLEKLDLAPENRCVSVCTVLLGRLKEVLLAGTDALMQRE